MGFGEILSDLYSLVTFTDVYAEAPPPAEAKDSEEAQEGGEEKEEKGGEGGESSEDGTDSEAVGGGEAEEKEEGAEGEEKAEEEEEEEEEAEEEEPEDIKPKLEEECARSAQCASVKHHYDACADRVAAEQENPDHKGPKEDCLEEFFHLTHCATQCAAPKLFRQLK